MACAVAPVPEAGLENKPVEGVLAIVQVMPELGVPPAAVKSTVLPANVGFGQVAGVVVLVTEICVIAPHTVPVFTQVRPSFVKVAVNEPPVVGVPAKV